MMLNWILMLVIAGVGGMVIGTFVRRFLGEGFLTTATGAALAFVWGYFVCSVFISGGLI